MDNRYKKHPPRKFILQVVAVTKLSDRKFEVFFGLYRFCISYYRRGVSEIPKKYWHLFYDPPETLRKLIEKHNSFASRISREQIFIPKIHQAKKQVVKKIGVLEKLLT